MEWWTGWGRGGARRARGGGRGKLQQVDASAIPFRVWCIDVLMRLNNDSFLLLLLFSGENRELAHHGRGARHASPWPRSRICFVPLISQANGRWTTQNCSFIFSKKERKQRRFVDVKLQSKLQTNMVQDQNGWIRELLDANLKLGARRRFLDETSVSYCQRANSTHTQPLTEEYYTHESWTVHFLLLRECIR
jgi:hypothetical protein